MVGYGSVQILHDKTVATGIRNGAKMVVEGGVSLRLRFSCFHGVKQNNAFCTYLKEGVRE